MNLRSCRFACLVALALFASCEDGPTGPQPSGPVALLVLNSGGQTLAAFSLSDTVVTASRTPIDLGAGFDGVTVDATATHAVTTVSSFGGSRVLFAELSTGTVTTSTFPVPEAGDANPSRPTFDAGGTAWIAGRGSDAIYSTLPGGGVATRLASSVGTFVERVLPFGSELFALDAFIDDDGGTFAPLGNSRIIVVNSANGFLGDTIRLPAGAVNAIDAVQVGNRFVVLLGGTFDGATFAPNGDGGLVVVDPVARTTGPLVALGGNGVAIEAGTDGRVHVTATSDFATIDALSFDPATGTFVNGPAAPFVVRDSGGLRVNCWAITGLDDGRRLCITSNFAASGRLLVVDANGDVIDEVPSGFGSVDIFLR
jgi:hypothetical protein